MAVVLERRSFGRQGLVAIVGAPTKARAACSVCAAMPARAERSYTGERCDLDTIPPGARFRRVLRIDVYPREIHVCAECGGRYFYDHLYEPLFSTPSEETTTYERLDDLEPVLAYVAKWLKEPELQLRPNVTRTGNEWWVRDLAHDRSVEASEALRRGARET